MRIRLLVLLLPLVLAAGAGAQTTGGLYGTVTRGPTMPVCKVGTPCSAPAVVTLVFSQSGREVARTQSRSNGAYRIVLRPGTYSVRTTMKLFGRIPRPSTVRAPAGRFAHVNFSIDTGIR